MAKKRNSRKHSTPKKSRHDYVRTKDPLRSFLGLDVPHIRLTELSSQPYSPYEKPQAIKGRFLSPSNPPTLSNKPVNLYQATQTALKQDIAPSVCSRRQQRKEVMHAFNHAGKAGQKKQQRTLTSNIQCKG